MARPEQTKTGRERLAEARAAQAKTDRNKKLGLIAGIVAVAVGISVGGYFLATSGDDGGGTVSNAGGKPANAKVVNSPVKNMYQWEGLTNDHVLTDVNYPMTPPVGGDHNEAWANCGIYDKEIPNKHAVHSLEHGAVWITTTSKVSGSELNKLKKLANQSYMLMSKYEKQDAPIVVSAWGHQIKTSSASDPRIKQFIKEYLQGPQTLEPGAACSGAYDPNTGQIG